MKERLAVIGAGLSGLYAAHRFSKTHRVTLFEARERPGGRIHTVDGFDLGPSWIWSHHRRMRALCGELGLQLFAQYDKGYALYESFERVEAFSPPSSAPAGRMFGGLGRLTDALAARLEGVEIHYGTAVERLVCGEREVTVGAAGFSGAFERVICTLPPRLALARLRIEPPLPATVVSDMQKTPTWMGHAIKCVITFERPFWRELGLSGFGVSHRGPMAEFHDACTPGHAALFGFVSGRTDMTRLREEVSAQLVRLFGEAASMATGFYCVDWRGEIRTSVPEDAAVPGMHPVYGLGISHGSGRLLFAGTECGFDEGGYMEGALSSIEQLRM